MDVLEFFILVHAYLYAKMLSDVVTELIESIKQKHFFDTRYNNKKKRAMGSWLVVQLFNLLQ